MARKSAPSEARPTNRHGPPDAIPPVALPDQVPASGSPAPFLEETAESSSPSVVPAPVQSKCTPTSLQPRIIRDGLIDTMVDWVKNYLEQLRARHAPRHVLSQTKQDLKTIESLRKDLVCLERSIELVGRDNAQVLIERAASIRRELITLYEDLVTRQG